MPTPIDRSTRKVVVILHLLGTAAITAFALAGRHNISPDYHSALSFYLIGISTIIVSSSFLAFALATIVIAVHRRKDHSLNWVAAAFGLFLLLEIVNHELIASTYRSHHLLLIGAIQALRSIAALVTLIGLPAAITQTLSTLDQASQEKHTESILTAAAESSTDNLMMFDSVYNSMGDIVDLRFNFINNRGAALFNSTPQQLLGKNLYETFPNVYAPDRMERYKRVILSGQPDTFETEHQVFQSEGQPSRLLVRVTRLNDGITLTSTDITERYAAQRKLKQALAFNQATVNCSPFATIITDTLGRITNTNPAAQRMLQYTPQEMFGQDVVSLLHDPSEIIQRAALLASEFKTTIAPGHQVLRTAAEQGIPDSREWTYLRKDGTRLPVQLSITALKDHDDIIIGFMGIAYDLTERKQSEQYIYHLAHHDQLTGLPTRTLLRDRLEVATERARRSQDSVAVLMLDLDNFKRVNDSLGHQAGDILLCEVANRLRSCVRKSDTVARMGGDEFVILLSDLRDTRDIQDVAAKILSAVSQPVHLGRQCVTVTASIGISIFPGSAEIDSLFKNADLAMYRIKAKGRNGIEIFTPGAGMETLRRLELESALRTAIEAEEFEIVYQPQISFADNSLIGVEALLRWHSPEFGSIPPNTFIPIAEETGLIVPISEWVLSKACKEIAALQLRIGKPIGLAVNISPRQFQQKNFPTTVELALLDSGLQADQLELEITEQLLMMDSNESLEIMRHVRKLGVKFAIDDFGTGFSNMGYITRFNVDRIKIDRSFIMKCDTDSNSRAVTAAIIALAHSLDIEVIAEGVETTDHVETLINMQCDQAQGYLYSRPISLSALRSFAAASVTHPKIPGGRSGIRRAFSEIQQIQLEKV